MNQVEWINKPATDVLKSNIVTYNAAETITAVRVSSCNDQDIIHNLCSSYNYVQQQHFI